MATCVSSWSLGFAAVATPCPRRAAGSITSASRCALGSRYAARLIPSLKSSSPPSSHCDKFATYWRLSAKATQKKEVEISRNRPTKPELKLLKDIREFTASCDLPPNDLPTTAELARHGRQDLAKRVRRKGYEQVAQLLEQVPIADADGNPVSEGVKFTPNGSAVSNDDIELSSAEANGTLDVEEPSDAGGSIDEARHELSLSADTASENENWNGHASFGEDFVREASGDQEAFDPDVSREQLAHGEAVGYTTQGYFLDDEDIFGSSEPVGLALDITTEDKGDSNIKKVYKTSDLTAGDIINDGDEDDDVVIAAAADDDDDEEVEDEEGQEEEDDEYNEDDDDDDDDGGNLMPGRPDSESQSPDIVYRKAALLKAKLLQYFDKRREDLKEVNSLPSANRMQQNVATQQEWAPPYLDNIQIHGTQKSEAPKELEQLKGLLHSRELELVEVSKQLEDARTILSLARAKATAELVHVKQLTVEQDAQLHAAQQALSQMKQVHLEWWGEAGRVELAGSFNGWQHYILLNPDVSSEIPKPNGARGPMMWGTHLCLYPGVYEIKFIVDGNWQVDHRREVVTHSNQNNILRVE